MEVDTLFNKERSDAVPATAISIKANIHQIVGGDICSKQDKQRCNYNRSHQVPNKIKVGQNMLLKNQRRLEGNGGKFLFKCTFDIK